MLQVYLELNGTAGDSELVFERSRFYQLLDRHRNTIRIHINLPSEGTFIVPLSELFVCINKCKTYIDGMAIFSLCLAFLKK